MLLVFLCIAQHNCPVFPYQLFSNSINPFTIQICEAYTFCHTGLTIIFNVWHLGTLALRTEHQSAQMSKIKNGWLDK